MNEPTIKKNRRSTFITAVADRHVNRRGGLRTSASPAGRPAHAARRSNRSAQPRLEIDPQALTAQLATNTSTCQSRWIAH